MQRVMGTTDMRRDTRNPGKWGSLQVAEGLGLSVSPPLKPAPGVPTEAQALIAAGTTDFYPGATDSLGLT